jgi:hypothetical protein
MPSPCALRLTRTQWLICVIASIGFAFDIYELPMLPLVIKPALAALGGSGPDGVALLVPGLHGSAESRPGSAPGLDCQLPTPQSGLTR